MDIDLDLFLNDLNTYFNSPDALPGNGKKILLACMPKSASKRMMALLSGHPDLEEVQLSETTINNEEKLDTLWMLLQNQRNWVSHQHIHCSQTLPRILQKFGVYTVVLTRNLYDICYSIRDHLNVNHHFGHMAAVPVIYRRLEEEQQIDFIIDHIMPWYIKFYVSWKRVEQLGYHDVTWIDFEELVTAPKPALQQIFKRTGLTSTVAGSQIDLDTLIGLVDKEKPNFNKGISGRGQTGMTDTQKQRLADLCRYYPEVNFKPLGIT